MVKKILEDSREIRALLYEPIDHVEVGSNGCTKIVAYAEPGEHCDRPWFAVYEGEEIKMRIPATMVCVVYKSVV